MNERTVNRTMWPCLTRKRKRGVLCNRHLRILRIRSANEIRNAISITCTKVVDPIYTCVVALLNLYVHMLISRPACARARMNTHTYTHVHTWFSSSATVRGKRGGGSVCKARKARDEKEPFMIVTRYVRTRARRAGTAGSDWLIGQ